MNNNPENFDMDRFTISEKIFDEIILIFDEIKRLLSSWDFQFPAWKTALLSKKEDFFVLLKTILSDTTIEKFFVDKHDVNYLKWLKTSEFSLIFDIYKLLELYFASQYIPLEKDVIVPKLELLQTLEVQEEFGRQYLSSLLWNGNIFTNKNCYEVFNTFDLRTYTDQNLQIKVETLKKFLLSKKSKDVELIRFVGFLVKSIRDYLEVKNEESVVMQWKEEAKKKNGIVRDIFLGNLNFFDEFILWAKEHIGEKSDFTDIASLEDLQKDTVKYSDFLQFRKLFSSKYMKNVVVPYKNLFEKNDKIEKKYYSAILYDLNNLWEGYTKDISELAFFIWLKKWFILWDIYEFLYKQEDKFPDLSSYLSWLLWKEFTGYTNSLSQ